MDDSGVENPETLNGAGGRGGRTEREDWSGRTEQEDGSGRTEQEDWSGRTEREDWSGAMEWEGGKEGRK